MPESQALTLLLFSRLLWGYTKAAGWRVVRFIENLSRQLPGRKREGYHSDRVYLRILKTLDYDEILRPVYLFWGVKKNIELIKNDYLINLENKYKLFKYIPVISQEYGSNFEKGYITYKRNR